MNPLLQLMIPTTLAQHNEQIAVTALPNGRTIDGGLKLSLLFTLSLPTGQGIANTWFEHWNSDDVSKASIGVALRTGEWTFAFSDSTTQTGTTLATLKQKPQPYTRIPEMWALLFKDSAATAGSERRTARLKVPWHIEHDAAYLNYAIKKHHLARAAQRYAQRRGIDMFSAGSKSALDGQFASIDVYLHPNVGDTTTNIPIKDQLKGRADLLDPGSAIWMPTVTKALISSDNRDFLIERFQYGLSVLDSVDQPLAPLGLLGLWRHCALSLPVDSNRPIAQVLSAIDTVTTNLNIPIISLSQAQRMMEFLLSSRKKDTSANPCSSVPDADFHQTLGMVNRHPVLLRPLGLTVDVTLTLPAQAQKALLLTVSPPITNPSITCFRTAIYIGPAGTAGEPEFCARSHYEDDLDQGKPPDQIDDGYRLLRNRYLWLGATSKDDNTSALFYTTSQDATGSIHKTVNASFSHRRGSQYRQYATRVNAQQKAPDTVPSSRTAGIQLFHVARAARSQKASENSVDPKQPRVLFADDLILGYRVDMNDGRKDKDGKLIWFSLCERRSSYKSLEKENPFLWEPQTGEDLAIDEGFVTLGGVVEDGDCSTVVRIDQGLWTWNGENLSIRPFFSEADKETLPKVIFRLKSIYSVIDHSELPQRFDKTYLIRNRMVDLCGNSPKLSQCVPRDSASNDAVTLSHEFLREEPFRGPQVLLRQKIDRDSYPGDNIATLVLRDGSGTVERTVVPPREIRQLAEWAGKLDRGLPRGAFEQYWLDDKGRFITVEDEEKGGPNDKREVINSEKQDGLLRLRKSVPKHRYFPDPHVSCACIQFNPPPDCTQWTIKEPQYLSFYAQDARWPFANPVLLRLEPTDGDPHVKVGDVTLFPPTTFANTPGITFYIPKATDATVELSSAACTEEISSKNVVRLALDSTPENTPASSQDNYRRRSGANGQRPTLVSTNSSTSNTPPEIDDSEILRAMGIGDGTLSFRQAAAKLAKSGFWINGQNPTVSPAHQLRLVHAVKTPLRQPIVKDLTLTRQYGTTNAKVNGAVDPCIRSTGKITFDASYDLYIDDPARPRPYRAHYKETAFEIELPNTPLDPSQPLPNYLDGKQHIFHDNRARLITYSTVATSKFVGFYPDAQKHQSRFEIEQVLSLVVALKATVRPPAPVIAYIIPAFRWDETYNNGKFQKSRVCHLRVYMERPHPVTDNDQMLGVVLASPDTTSSSSVNSLVSKIGMDPTQGSWSQRGLTKETMDPTMFTNSVQTGAGFLAESTPTFATDGSNMGAVDILGFETHFVESRNLWFADIAIQPTEKWGDDDFWARSPFVQLALTRYAPNGLVGTSPLDDARMSAVVLADFIQLAEDRCCTVSRHGKSITVCISGPFVAAAGSANQRWCLSRRRWEWTRETRISLELQHRWHSVDGEVSWLPVDPKVNNPEPFKFIADDEHGLGSLTFSFNLPHSPAWFKYAVLIMEEEIIPAKDSSTSEIYRARYFDQVEI